MAPRGDNVQRVASVAELPKFRAALPLQIRAETGNVLGKVRWMDTAELIFWSSTRVAPGRDLMARLALTDNLIVELTIRVVDGEMATRHRDGHVHIARWMGKDDAARDHIHRSLRDLAPEVFAPGYRRTRPALVEDASAAQAEKRARRAELMATVKEQYDRELRDRKLAARRFRRRYGAVAAIALGLGLVLGAVGAMATTDFRVARVLLWRWSPKVAIEYGVLEGASLVGEDFEGTTVAGAVLRNARLVGASFRNADLAGTDLSGADLRRSDFSGSRLGDANLSGARLAGARFAGADVRGSTLVADPTGADFRGALFDSGTRWQEGRPAVGALGPKANAAGLVIQRPTATGATLDGIDLSDSVLTEANLAGASLKNGVLARTRIPAGKLGKVDLTGARADGLVCVDCTFAEATLRNFSIAQADLTRADLSKTVAPTIMARGATLDSANLTGADWTGADLRGATLRGANLDDAELGSCIALGADFTDARLGSARLRGCVADAKTKWPAGFDARAAGVVTLGPASVLVDLKLPPSTDLSALNLNGLDARRLSAEGAIFRGSRLDGAVFTGAALVSANFDDAALGDARFTGANLANARFQGADLTNANFEGALLCGADFKRARLDRARFKGAAVCAGTQWPSGRHPDGVHVQ